jgi:hypothetical protein
LLSGYTSLATDYPGIAAYCLANCSNGERMMCDLLSLTECEVVHLLGALNWVTPMTQLGEE